MIKAHICNENYLYIKTRVSSGYHPLIINIEVNDLSESKEVEFQKSACTFVEKDFAPVISLIKKEWC